MKNLLLAVLLLIGFVIGWYVITGRQLPGGPPAPQVATTIFPLYDITKNIVGDTIEVVLILPPGASPHTYDPKPEEIRKLAQSQALFMIGYGLDDWASRIGQAAGVSNIVTVDDGVQLRTFGEGEDEEDHDEEEEDDDYGHEPGSIDPHYWLTISNARAIIRHITNELSILYPEHAHTFVENAQLYDQALVETDQRVRLQLEPYIGLPIATMHDAWGYFAEAYGLEVVAVFEEVPGSTPGAVDVLEFQNVLREQNVAVVFAEPQLSSSVLEPIVRDAGAQLSILDPIGGVQDRATYIQLMEYNVEQVVNAGINF